ncbi:MAG: methyltransferase domain-containing protein [Bacteroidota bacterium]|nr:methyltransferase domain-containing protein [Bacteroidota bacterium]
MSRYHAYLKRAVSLLEQYDGNEPFSIYYKNEIAKDKKVGSTDRKLVRHYCYTFFRIGFACAEASIEERLLIAVYLIQGDTDPLIKVVRPEWVGEGTTTFEQRLALACPAFSWQAVFPLPVPFSMALTLEEWAKSLLSQPAFFIRTRPGKQQSVINKLEAASLSFKIISSSSLALPAATKLDTVLELNQDYVVQDLSSQRVGDFLKALLPNSIRSVWDCCAASGGKSLLLMDQYPSLELTVSDVRPSILQQLKTRFKQAGIANYQSLLLDLTQQPFPTNKTFFDLIIADVPCSGSGTWARTPEQITKITATQLLAYTKRQQSILSRLPAVLKSGGYLLYCTCSVFASENEEQVAWLQREFGFSLCKQALLEGMDESADTLFVALLQKTSN